MKCIICHGDNIQVKEVKEEIFLGNDIVHIPIKIPVCMTCGERYYDRRTMQFLERIENKISGSELKLKEIGKVLVYDEAGSVA
ncbi:MAG: YgiT-type zinc finger protein [Desulfobacterales bacterium]